LLAKKRLKLVVTRWPAFEAWVFMTRIALTLYLVLASAVGPSLCCCLPSELLGFYTSDKQSHRCCGHHAAKHSPRPAKTKQDPATPSPVPQKDCPCKEGQSKPVLFTPAHESPASEYSRTLMLPQWAAVGGFLPGTGSITLYAQEQPTSHCITFPFLSSREILRAIQVLRC